MAKQKPLVVQHLEDISWSVLEEYPQIIKLLIKGRSGIYALYKRDHLYYVGLARNLMARLKSHLKDRHRGRWDRFSVYLTIHDDHMRELELMVLRIVTPHGNKAKGKFAQSENLLRALHDAMREFDADRRARVLGGHIAERRQKAKTRKGSLAGVLEGRTKLKAIYNRQKFSASLRQDGKISLNKKLYASPSAAAKAATGTEQNGWEFWLYRNKKGRWVPLSEIRD